MIHILYQTTSFYIGSFNFPQATNGTSVSWFATRFVTKYVGWYWDVNNYVGAPSSTLPGVRTPSSWWRSTLNTEWGDFKICKTGRRVNEWYILDHTPGHWSYQHYIQGGIGEDDPQLELVVMKLDMQENFVQNWELLYMSHPLHISGMREPR